MEKLVLLLALDSGVWGGDPRLEAFRASHESQAVFRLNSQATIERVPVTEEKWVVSGGHEGIPAWRYRSLKYAVLPSAPAYSIAKVPVVNSFKEIQHELALVREYPVGAVFHDVLVNARTRKVYEHRVRRKTKAGWRSRVEHSDRSQRPAGYDGLKQSCASCHDQAGAGKYGVGMVPGGDTVLSHPLDWSMLKGRPDILHRAGKANPGRAEP